MQNDYRPFMDRMIQRYEGGYGWDKGDPGGPTKYGITCYDLAEHRGIQMKSMDQWAPVVANMDLAEAEEIYATKYATALKFNMLPPGVDCCMMDYGVNSGIVRAIRVARVLTNKPGSDVLDMELFDAIVKMNPTIFIEQMCTERLQFMERLRTWDKFGRGWTARVNDLKLYCDHLARNAPLPQIPSLTVPIDPHPKALQTHTDINGPLHAAIAAPVVFALSGGRLLVALGAGIAVFAVWAAYEIYQQHKDATTNLKVIHPGMSRVG